MEGLDVGLELFLPRITCSGTGKLCHPIPREGQLVGRDGPSGTGMVWDPGPDPAGNRQQDEGWVHASALELG